ncbi:MAG: hypothetical protein AAGF11_17530 [Myxococcota bacterium]
MNRINSSRTRFSLRAGGIVAIAAGLLMTAPIASARAADHQSEADGIEDAELLAFGQRFLQRREALADVAVECVRDALGRSAERVGEAANRMELVLTWGYGIDGLAWVDPSVFAGPADKDEAAPASSRRRLDIVTGTNDPLAGL